MSKILDGKIVKEERQKKLTEAIGALGFSPTLAIIQVGKREDSNTYIAHKKKLGEEVGAKVNHLQFPENAQEHEIIAAIRELNADKTVHGIIVQIPLPTGIDRDNIIDAIAPKKDV